MPKTNWQDPGSSEVRSTHISGLQEAVGKIEDILNMQLQAETNVELSEVYISEQNRYRIFQAPEGKRNWASDPAPVIKKNGVPIASGFVIDYGGGAVIFSTPVLGSDTVTADFSRVKIEGSIIDGLVEVAHDHDNYDVLALLSEDVDGTLLYNGVPIGATPDAGDIPYDNEESELEATKVQGAIDETVDMVKTHKADYATFKTNTNAEIVEIKKKIGIVHNIESWAEVQAIVRAGIADQVFKVGDMLVSEYNGEEVIWTIIGIDHDTPTDTEYSHSLTIQTRDCLDNVQFDAPEPTNPDENRQEYGNNRYLHSAIRQWLNSNDDVFQWVSQHEYDVAPTGAIYEGPGFLKLLDPELAAVIGAVDKQVARNTVTDGGGQDLFSDKVFLLSRVEVYSGTEGDTTGEKPYAYYSALAGAPTTDPLAGRIKLLNGSPRPWWLRSPNVGNSYSVRDVHAPGRVHYTNAHTVYGLSPACCII
jgi:hypothetical protein